MRDRLRPPQGERLAGKTVTLKLNIFPSSGSRTPAQVLFDHPDLSPPPKSSPPAATCSRARPTAPSLPTFRELPLDSGTPAEGPGHDDFLFDPVNGGG